MLHVSPCVCSELQDDTLVYDFTAQHAEDLRLDDYRPSQGLDPAPHQDFMEDMAPFGQSTAFEQRSIELALMHLLLVRVCSWPRLLPDVEVGRHDQTADSNAYPEFDRTNTTADKEPEAGVFQMDEMPEMDAPEAFQMPPPEEYNPE